MIKLLLVVSSLLFFLMIVFGGGDRYPKAPATDFLIPIASQEVLGYTVTKFRDTQNNITIYVRSGNITAVKE